MFNRQSLDSENRIILFTVMLSAEFLGSRRKNVRADTGNSVEETRKVAVVRHLMSY